MPPDTVTEGGVGYTLEKGTDGKPVSRQQKVRDVGALNQADYFTELMTTNEEVHDSIRPLRGGNARRLPCSVGFV
jgi:hypothetical protein